MEMEVLVHPQLGLRFGAALPGAFFSQKNNTFEKNMIIAVSYTHLTLPTKA